MEKPCGIRDFPSAFLQHPGFTEGLANCIRRDGGADRAVRALRREFFPMEDVPLSEDEYVVPVGYDMPRDRVRLEAVFSVDGVADSFYSHDYSWAYHLSCAGIDLTPGERTMRVERVDLRFADAHAREPFIEDMDRRGYRPAIHHEAYAFTKSNAEVQRMHSIFVLGSFFIGPFGRVYLMRLTTNADKLVLMRYPADDPLGPGTHFLFVRKHG